MLPDMPVVYCSETFSTLTEYPPFEILGRNCRFLQRPQPHLPGNKEPIVQDINTNARVELKYRFSMGEEARVRLVNYKKSGTKFVNLLTTIPITWDEGEPNAGSGKRYIVGFQADSQTLFGSG
jgi:PAS domain-containing protein